MARYKRWWQFPSSAPLLDFSFTRDCWDIPASLACKTQWNSRPTATTDQPLFKTDGNCLNSARNPDSRKRKRHFQLLLVNGPSDSTAMNILGLLPRMTTRNQFIIVIPDGFIKLTPALPSSRTTVWHVASILLGHWIVYYGNLTVFLIDSGLQLMRKLFETLFTFIRIKQLPTTVYYPQTSGQAEGYNKTFMTCFHEMLPGTKVIGRFS